MPVLRIIGLLLAALWLTWAPPAQAQPARFDVWIDAVHDVAASEAGCGSTEYFARVSFDGRNLVRTPLYSVSTDGGTIGGVDFTPGGWIAPYATTIVGRFRVVTVRVALLEQDSGLCFGNDQVDITPARGKTLQFTVYLGADGFCSVRLVPGMFGARLPCGMPFTVRRVVGCSTCSGVTLRIFRLL